MKLAAFFGAPLLVNLQLHDHDKHEISSRSQDLKDVDHVPLFFTLQELIELAELVATVPNG